MKILKVRDIDEVMEFQQRNHWTIRCLCSLSYTEAHNFFWTEGNLLNDILIAGTGLTLHLHSPHTAAFYDEHLEPIKRREVLVYCINHVTVSQSEDILISNLASNIQPWHLKYARCTQLVMCTWSIQGYTCVDSSQIW